MTKTYWLKSQKTALLYSVPILGSYWGHCNIIDDLSCYIEKDVNSKELNTISGINQSKSLVKRVNVDED